MYKDPTYELLTTPTSSMTTSTAASGSTSPSPPPRAYPEPGSLGIEKLPYLHKLVRLTTNSLYECQHCGILYQDDILHDLHMLAHSTDNPFTCVCGYDATGASQIYYFNAHLVLGEHQLPLKYSSLDSQWSPNLPAPGSLGTQTVTEESRNNWINNGPVYECPVCNIIYKDDVVYDIHAQSHIIFRNRISCVCGVAGDKYQYNAHLYARKHNLIHKYNIP